jgi:ABC-type multidrug transport system ATPase subunit
MIPRAVFANCLAYVEQNFAFFAGTVEDNLTLWDRSISPARLVRSCQEAAIHEVVGSLPGGYSAELIESAGNLSGGERQRLELARALLRDPVILILDEVYSALDTETEHRIHRHLRQRGCSCLIIAHRLSTIHDCDEILVMKDGRVVERGRHDELLQKGGEYARLIQTDDTEGPPAPGARATDSRDSSDLSQYVQRVLVFPPRPEAGTVAALGFAGFVGLEPSERRVAADPQVRRVLALPMPPVDCGETDVHDPV